MNVFIVFYDMGYDGRDIAGVFSSRSKAIDFIKGKYPDAVLSGSIWSEYRKDRLLGDTWEGDIYINVYKVDDSLC